MEKRISNVISVCTQKDLQVWKTTSRFMLKNISSSSYLVIVPQVDVKVFMNATPSDIQIIPEDEVLGFANILRIKEAISNESRFGWYLQQFLKICAISQGENEDVNLIWDSDTVPLTRLSFIDENYNLSYYTGTEHHTPYFDQIERSLQLKKIVDYSFIAQCFPAKVCWARSYIDALESKNKCHWIDAILKSIDPKELSGFSEYESMGTYFSHNFQNEMTTSQGKWERSGNRLIGINKFTDTIASKLGRRLDFIAFEAWEKPRQSLLDKVKRFFKFTELN